MEDLIQSLLNIDNIKKISFSPDGILVEYTGRLRLDFPLSIPVGWSITFQPISQS